MCVSRCVVNDLITVSYFPDAGMFRGQVWNSASSELFMFGKSSLLAELRFAPDYRRGNLPVYCLKR